MRVVQEVVVLKIPQSDPARAWDKIAQEDVHGSLFGAICEGVVVVPFHEDDEVARHVGPHLLPCQERSKH